LLRGTNHFGFHFFGVPLFSFLTHKSGFPDDFIFIQFDQRASRSGGKQFLLHRDARDFFHPTVGGVGEVAIGDGQKPGAKQAGKGPQGKSVPRTRSARQMDQTFVEIVAV
jgi:hypothetical protein